MEWEPFDFERLDSSAADPWSARDYVRLDTEVGIPRVAIAATVLWYGFQALGRLAWSGSRALLTACANGLMRHPLRSRSSVHGSFGGSGPFQPDIDPLAGHSRKLD